MEFIDYVHDDPYGTWLAFDGAGHPFISYYSECRTSLRLAEWDRPLRPLLCDAIEVYPDPMCENGCQAFTAVLSGGDQPMAVSWDYDGDAVPDGAGPTWVTTLPPGSWTVTATAVDSRVNAGPQTCSMTRQVTVHASPVPAIHPLDAASFCSRASETCRLDAGPGCRAYQWRLDGGDIPGATAQVYAASKSGDYTVTIIDANGCPGTSAAVTLDAEDCSAYLPGEVSCQSSGEPPLLALKAGSGALIIEAEKDATAYNFYADTLGSWYYPTSAKGSVCKVRSWTDNADGTVTLDLTLPGNAWFMVTASNPAGEGPVGENSGGVERTTLGAWELCGSAP